MKGLVGHHDVRAQLALLLAEGRFPHAVLLHGPQGIGKRKLADGLLARLMCGPAGAAGSGLFGDDVGDSDPLAADMTGAVWYQLQAGSCPDAYVLAPEEGKKSTGIKQVQGLLEALLRSADTARVVIVDSLDDLTTEAANTLLKTLEEPRKGIYFVLLAHQLSAVLPTIRSRCRLMQVRPLTEAEVETVLGQENGDVSLAPLAGGCPGRVLGGEAAARLAAHDAVAGGGVPAMNSPMLADVLAEALARQGQTLAQADAYRTVVEMARRAQALNIPVAALNEAAYAIYKGAMAPAKEGV